MSTIPTARWTVTQPWRGIFALLVTVGITFGLTVAFNMPTYQGIFTAWAISMVPIEVIMGLIWGSQYPAEKLDNPWKGIALTAFMFLIGTIAMWWVLKFVGAGVFGTPMVNVFIIITVITTFFAVIAFGGWPFQKMSRPAHGFLTLIACYLVTLLIFRLYDFGVIHVPDVPGVTGLLAVPLTNAGGALEAFAGIDPNGPFAFEGLISFQFWMIVGLFVMVVFMGYWPWTKFPVLLKQPVMGIWIVIICGVFGLAAQAIGVWAMGLEPIYFLMVGIAFLFGALMILFLFQMWPGRRWAPPIGGLVNLLIAVPIAIVGFYAYDAFADMHFGAAMVWPVNYFTLANMMLALSFPAWAMYSGFFDFWPLPPTPPPPGAPK